MVTDRMGIPDEFYIKPFSDDTGAVSDDTGDFSAVANGPDDGSQNWEELGI